jgi:hypothetical protein
MIVLDTGQVNAEIAALMARFEALPNHIARKHAAAAVKRVMKGMVPILKKNTPKRGKRLVFNNRRPGGEYGVTKIKGGSLRASVAMSSTYIRAKGGGSTVTGVVGYRSDAKDPYNGVSQSRKAIWLEFGTENAFARGMVAMTLRQVGPVSAAKLAAEMSVALDKAAKELASKMNPGTSRRGSAAGIAPQ